MSIERLTEDLFKVRDLALETQNPSAGVSAIMAMAKLHGYLVTKIEQNVNIGLADKLLAARTRVGLEVQ